jgi:hypothetical protein
MIYEPFLHEGYELLHCCNGADYEVFHSFDGSPRAGTWIPIKVRIVRSYDRQKYKRSDFPWLVSQALVMRENALIELRSLIEPFGEILPLIADDETQLYAANVSVIDALDEEHSAIERIPGTNRIMTITRIAFREPMVRDVDIVRLPHRASPTYVSQRFVDATNAANLEGLEFIPVWPNDRGAAATPRPGSTRIN